jgi:hypothetical protein
MIWDDTVRYNMMKTWYDKTQYDTKWLRHDMIWYSMTQYDKIWLRCDMIWHSTIQYD